MSTNVEALRSEVLQAFADRGIPTGSDLTHHDPRYPDEDGARLAAFLRGRDWRTIDFDTLQAHYAGDPRTALVFMRGDAVPYYLPAFLRMAIDGLAADEWDMPEAVALALTRPQQDAGQQALFDDRVRDLRPAERAAVRRVLEHIDAAYAGAGYEANPARLALTSYWTGGG